MAAKTSVTKKSTAQCCKFQTQQKGRAEVLGLDVLDIVERAAGCVNIPCRRSSMPKGFPRGISPHMLTSQSEGLQKCASLLRL